jgi:hypothetical protein
MLAVINQKAMNSVQTVPEICSRQGFYHHFLMPIATLGHTHPGHEYIEAASLARADLGWMCFPQQRKSRT